MKSDNKYADINSFISFFKNKVPNGTYPDDEINYVAENIPKNAYVKNYFIPLDKFREWFKNNRVHVEGTFFWKKRGRAYWWMKR